MQFKVNAETQKIDCILSMADPCYICKNNNKCPLIEAGKSGIIYPARNEIFADNCKLFKFQEIDL